MTDGMPAIAESGFEGYAAHYLSGLSSLIK